MVVVKAAEQAAIRMVRTCRSTYGGGGARHVRHHRTTTTRSDQSISNTDKQDS